MLDLKCRSSSRSSIGLVSTLPDLCGISMTIDPPPPTTSMLRQAFLFCVACLSLSALTWGLWKTGHEWPQAMLLTGLALLMLLGLVVAVRPHSNNWDH